jgi:hypothetical protein
LTDWVSTFQVRSCAPPLELATFSAKKETRKAERIKEGKKKRWQARRKKLVEGKKIKIGRKKRKWKAGREKERKKENCIDIVLLKSRISLSVSLHESRNKIVAAIATSAVTGSVDALLKPSALSAGMKL